MRLSKYALCNSKSRVTWQPLKLQADYSPRTIKIASQYSGTGQCIGTLFNKSAARKLLQEQSHSFEAQGSEPQPTFHTANGHAEASKESTAGQQSSKKGMRKSAMAIAKSDPREKAQKARQAARVLQSLDTKVRAILRTS